MDVDEDIYDFLPFTVKANMIYHCRIYTSADEFSDFVITGGNRPVLYELAGRQILSSLQLDDDRLFKGSSIYLITKFHHEFNLFVTFAVGVALPTVMQNDDTGNISIKVYFSYKKKIKESFYFLKIAQHLAIIGKVDQQLTVNEWHSQHELSIIAVLMCQLTYVCIFYTGLS